MNLTRQLLRQYRDRVVGSLLLIPLSNLAGLSSRIIGIVGIGRGERVVLVVLTPFENLDEDG